MALALAMLPAILLPPILGDELPRPAERVLDIVDWTVWGAFAAVFLAKVAVAPQRWRYVRTHPVELLLVALPFLRPLRLLRLLAVVGLDVALISRFFEKRGMRLLILGLAATMIAGAILVWAMERHAPEHDGLIETPTDALWWAFITMTSVGYGDHSPATGGGRIVTGVMTLVGIVGVSILSGAVAALLIRDESANDAVMRELAALREEVAEWRGETGGKRRDRPTVRGSVTARLGCARYAAPAREARSMRPPPSTSSPR